MNLWELSYDELFEEAQRLRRENKRLEMERDYYKKEHMEFLDKTINGTTLVTNEWVKLLLNGDLKIQEQDGSTMSSKEGRGQLC